MNNLDITLEEVKNLIRLSTGIIWHENAAYISIHGQNSQTYAVYGDSFAALAAVEAASQLYTGLAIHDNTSVEAWLNYLCLMHVISIGTYTIVF